MKWSKQIGTSDHGGHGAEDRRDCVHFLQKATEDSIGDVGWLWREVDVGFLYTLNCQRCLELMCLKNIPI